MPSEERTINDPQVAVKDVLQVNTFHAKNSFVLFKSTDISAFIQWVIAGPAAEQSHSITFPIMPTRRREEAHELQEDDRMIKAIMLRTIARQRLQGQ